MMRTLFRVSPIALFSNLCLLACAGSTPSPSSPTASNPAAEQHAEAAPASTLAPEKTEAEATTAPAKEKAESPAPPADDSRDGLRKASRPPMEMLTGNNVVYLLNYSDSKIGNSAKERCDSENADDSAAARECLAKARGKVPVESVRFVKSASGQYWWVTYNRYKGNLLKWHSIQFMPGKEDADSITLTLTGKDKGIAPAPRVPPSLNIELPNDYSIVIRDPEYGEMVFDAKIGLLEPDQPE